MLPTVSIIVPVYNSAEHLEECLMSIANQTFNDIEVIIINDGSTDSSGQICDSFANKYNFIHVTHIHNSGVSNARNLGIELSNGEYVTFVDSDDIIDTHYIAKLIFAISNTNADYAICAFDCFSENGQIRHINYLYNQGETIDIMSYLSILSSYQAGAFWGANWAKLYKSETIKKHSIRFKKFNCFAEDLKFNLEYLTHVNSIAIIHDALYKYREYTSGSLSKKRKEPAVFWNDYRELYEHYCNLYKMKFAYKKNKYNLEKFLLNGCNTITLELFTYKEYKICDKFELLKTMIKYVSDKDISLINHIKSPLHFIFLTKHTRLYYLLFSTIQTIKSLFKKS